MHPPVKDQEDIGADNPTIDASASDENKDYTRQEYAQEADTNYMLSRFGITPPRNAPVYGEWDDTIDLQIALEAVREAQRGFNTLPEDMRRKFGSMEELLRAVDNGSLVITDKEADQAGTPPPVPPA